LKALQPEVERLKGERDYLERENKKLKEKFNNNQQQFQEFNVHKTLFKMDPHKYGQTMADMANKKESYPVWADMNFLERGTTNESVSDVN